MKYPDNLIVIDDDKIFLLIHKNLILNSTGREPLTFNHGKQALQYLDECDIKQKEILLFLDLNMPVMNGWEFLDQLHTRDYAVNIYVVIVTSSLLHEDYEKARAYNRVLDYQTKPFDVHKFNEVLEIYNSVISQ